MKWKLSTRGMLWVLSNLVAVSTSAFLGLGSRPLAGDWSTILGCIPAMTGRRAGYMGCTTSGITLARRLLACQIQIEYLGKSLVYQLVTMQENRTVLPYCMREVEESRERGEDEDELHHFVWGRRSSAEKTASWTIPSTSGICAFVSL